MYHITELYLAEKERPNQKKDVIQEVRSSTEEDPGLNETDRTTHSVEGTLHCIIEDKECQDLMEAYCEKYLKQIRIIYYNMTDERIKPHKKGCFILKSKEERLGDTFINTFKKCNHISDEQSLLLIVLNKTGKKIHLPPTEEISIKLKTQILFKRGRIFESDTNIAAVSDIKQFVQGRKGDV
ncbi:uncharacterized protein LOC134228525 [Saccostrea cucullata]|uniref:uncharacterized protein LOC134228525 n=1 Tax=Saccostrea cuccullata TaxID=36930 RepID=UPI002ED24A93